jgi:hypothetical protein
MIEDLISSYFRQISRVPLLSQEQEILLGRQVQAMVRGVSYHFIAVWL